MISVGGLVTSWKNYQFKFQHVLQIHHISWRHQILTESFSSIVVMVKY